MLTARLLSLSRAATRPGLQKSTRVRRFIPSFSRHASSSTLTPTSSTVDPTDAESQKLLESGTQKLEEGDLQGAKELYKRSVEMRRAASGLFNLGVAQFHLSESASHIAIPVEGDNQ